MELDEIIYNALTSDDYLEEVTGGRIYSTCVEVPPTDDYCNISTHPVWPVLLIISLILNAGLVGLIVVYVARKRKKVTDDIPLVDYDINDDI